ncbi:MAG: hypothetical protein RMJ00_02205 [Nitrososphaerota archaeon]|nr:hypothetical protein [Candidatus Bathyarchaeota archaeon]MDW8061493.1 hypothetical protein [Nitrososphaerota archaeon]
MLLNVQQSKNQAEGGYGKDDRIHIRLKFGDLEVDVECRQEQLKDIIDTFLSSLREKGLPTISPTVSTSYTRGGEPKTCRDIILSLWRNGWFSTSRSLSEVDEEMSRMGYHYNRSAIAHSLADLVREGILSREGRKGSYRYLQKRPPI